MLQQVQPVVYVAPQQTVVVNNVVAVQRKSVGVALVLTFFFGPLGMLYSTVPGALVMGLLYVVVGVATLGLGLMVLWPLCMVWAAAACQ